MNKKGSVLMISLWILAILVVFVVGLGHRASLNLRLARYQRDRLKATYLAKAGVNRAIVELENDTTANYDTLNNNWVNNETVFKNILLNEDKKDEFATVSYTLKKDGKEETKFGVSDEESKLNINNLNKQELEQLFIQGGVTEKDVEDLADIIMNWISITKEEGKEIFKDELLRLPEELLLILEYFYQNKGEENYQKKTQEVFNNIKDLITVWGQTVNINTASDEVIEILLYAAAKKMNEDHLTEPTQAEIIELKDSIVTTRDGKPFETGEDWEGRLGIASDTAKYNAFQRIKPLGVQSNNFRIQSTGNVGNITKKITAIVKRGAPREIIYWHEN